MLQNGQTHFKNLTDSRFIIRFKIICCKILRVCLTPFGISDNFHGICCSLLLFQPLSWRQLAYYVILFFNCQILIFAIGKTQIKEIIRWKHKYASTQARKHTKHASTQNTQAREDASTGTSQARDLAESRQKWLSIFWYGLQQRTELPSLTTGFY